jgi:MoaA/NifB/PqqE/SkfB family radical SAM enzyme
VSHYDDDLCFSSVSKLVEEGVRQVNIHQLVSEETLADCIHLIEQVVEDPRLTSLNAIIFLSLKKKGRGKSFSPLNQEKFNFLLKKAFQKNIRIGFDSCSTFKFLKSVQHTPHIEWFKTIAEPCESSLFSAYINTGGKFFPCSFVEGEKLFPKGLDVISCRNFLEEIWYHPTTNRFRRLILNSELKNKFCCRMCPQFEI